MTKRGERFESILASGEQTNVTRAIEAGVLSVLMDRVTQQLAKYTPVGAPTDCWIWTGARQTNGYGVVRAYRHGVTLRFPAHRLALIVSGCDVPRHLDACHTCDVRACVNPAHIFAGTRLDNMRDCARKGRAKKPRGDANWAVKLSANDVRTIRERVAGGESGRSVARNFGVNSGTVSRIVRRLSREEVA